MLNNKLLYCCIVILLIGFIILFLNINTASCAVLIHVDECAKRPDVGGIWDKMELCRKCGDCELSHFAQLAVNYANRILGIVGSLALLAFIYGGVMFLISAGNTERVTKAKTIIIGAVIGLIIVFASFMIINFIITGLGYSSSFGKWYIVK